MSFLRTANKESSKLGLEAGVTVNGELSSIKDGFDGVVKDIFNLRLVESLWYNLLVDTSLYRGLQWALKCETLLLNHFKCVDALIEIPH